MKGETNGEAECEVTGEMTGMADDEAGTAEGEIGGGDIEVKETGDGVRVGRGTPPPRDMGDSGGVGTHIMVN